MNTLRYIVISIITNACFFCNLLSMEQNQHIGPIDKKILLLEINTKGQNPIKAKIDSQLMGPEYGTRRMPFSITHYFSNDNSDLSNMIFSAVNSNAVVETQNSENRRWNERSKNLIPIDQCSCAKKINDNSIMVMTIFHDKPALQALFLMLTNR